MKKLSIEEKAKAYDKAIESLRAAFYDDNNRMCKEYRDACKRLIEPIFPELKESEEEKTRKYLISFVKLNSGINLPPEDAEQILAWLEKQGEREPVVVIPKFRVGDCYTPQRFYGRIHHRKYIWRVLSWQRMGIAY